MALGRAINWSDVPYNLVVGEAKDGARSVSRPRNRMAVWNSLNAPNLFLSVWVFGVRPRMLPDFAAAVRVPRRAVLGLFYQFAPLLPRRSETREQVPREAVASAQSC